MTRRVFAAHLDELAGLRQFVGEMARQAGLSPEADYRLRLAVDEIATNIITHGYEEAGRSGDLVVSAEVDPSELRIVLEDSGIPFDPRSRAVPSRDQLERPLEERAIGGLGLYMVMEGVDRFDYEYAGERNRNILVMRR